MRPLVVTDATALIGLSRIAHLHLLPGLYRRVVAPDEVAREFGERPEWLEVQRVDDRDAVRLLVREGLHFGEAEAITLARMLPDAQLLIDERKGRRVAVGFGLSIVGTAGLLGAAKGEGLIENVRPLLTELVEKHDFRLAPKLIEQVLRLVGED